MTRVLHLAPSSADADRLTAHACIDEEIRALSGLGVECFVLSDAAAAVEYRGGVTIVTVPKNPGIGDIGDAARFAAKQALRIPWYGSPWELFHAVRIELVASRAIAEYQIDVIHSHFGWPAGFGGALAAAETGAPLVASLRGMDLLRSDALDYGLRRDVSFDRAIRGLLASATRTVYATEFMRTAGVDAGAASERTVLIRKGVDLTRFHPAADRREARRALGVYTPIVLAAGALIPRKGYNVLLNALAPLGGLPWTLVICGDGPDRALLEAQALALGLRDRVRFAGLVDRDTVARYFSAADLFVHTAAIEAAGSAVLEALAAGVPVICVDAGGPQEHIVDGQTGFLIGAGDRVALTRQIRALLEQPAVRAAVSLAARTAAERQYDYRRMIDEYVALYASCRAPASAEAA